MSKLAVETRLGSVTSYSDASTDYDETELGLTSIIRQYNGTEGNDKFAGPLPIGIYRPITTGLAIPGIFPWSMQWSDDIDWVFMADGAAAAATRRIQMATFKRSTSEYNIVGGITVSFPALGNKIVRAFRMDYQTYSTGTIASADGTSIEGTSTAWADARLAVGGRIGFGSTDPTAITTWYQITAITDNDSITIGASAGVMAAGTAYVIEELRAIMGVTNSTVANGGLHIVKGLNPNIFTDPSTAVAAAVSTDNVRACYWLKDAATCTNTVTIGFGLDDKTSWTSHDIYILNTLANPVCYKFNIRAALTVATGASLNAFTFVTGAHGAVTGTTSQSNNCRIATASHGPGNGLKCLYFTTTTRVYRTDDVSTFYSTSTIWAGDNMPELPPGGANTFALTATMNSIDYSSTIDRFIISTSNKQYVAKYNTDGTAFDRVFTSLNYQQNQSTADGGLAPFPQAAIAYYTCWTDGGMLYIVGIGTTAITCIAYAIPLGADWEYSTVSGQRLIFPKYSTPGALSYIRAYANAVNVIGGNKGTITNLGMNPDAFKVSYRTSGISDNSGLWTDLDGNGDMLNVPACDEIQFSIIFKTISMTCIPSRILSLCLVYEDNSTDSHFQPSAGKSSASTATFAWRFSTAYGSAVPRLRVRLYNAQTGAGPLVEDDSTTQSGTWEKSTDGGTNWVAYNTTDLANTTTYIRFTPDSITNDITVKAILGAY